MSESAVPTLETRELWVRLSFRVGAWLGAVGSAAAAVLIVVGGDWNEIDDDRLLPTLLLAAIAFAVSLATQATWWMVMPAYEVSDWGLRVRVWPWKAAFKVPWERFAWHSVSDDRTWIHVSLGDERSRRCTLTWLSGRDRRWLIAVLDRRLHPTTTSAGA